MRVNPLPYKIVQRPKMIALLWEGNTHSYRRFFLDGRKPNLDVEPESYTGHSNGKWDGDTLVVDTVGFNDKTWLDSTGKPHSDAMHLIERYKRPDLGHLNVELTIDDPKAFTKPYSFTRTFTLAPGLGAAGVRLPGDSRRRLLTSACGKKKGTGSSVHSHAGWRSQEFLEGQSSLSPFPAPPGST